MDIGTFLSRVGNDAAGGQYPGRYSIGLLLPLLPMGVAVCEFVRLISIAARLGPLSRKNPSLAYGFWPPLSLMLVPTRAIPWCIRLNESIDSGVGGVGNTRAFGFQLDGNGQGSWPTWFLSPNLIRAHQ
jgi:hypothetical protein